MNKGQTPPQAYLEVSVVQTGRFSPACFYGAGAELHVSPAAPFLAQTLCSSVAQHVSSGTCLP